MVGGKKVDRKMPSKRDKGRNMGSDTVRPKITAATAQPAKLSAPSFSDTSYYKDPEVVRTLEHLADSRNLDAIVTDGFPNGEKTLRITLEKSPGQQPSQATEDNPSPSGSGLFSVFRRKKKSG